MCNSEIMKYGILRKTKFSHSINSLKFTNCHCIKPMWVTKSDEGMGPCIYLGTKNWVTKAKAYGKDYKHKKTTVKIKRTVQ